MVVGKFDKLIYFWCFNWIGWETERKDGAGDKSHGVLGKGSREGTVNMTSKIIYFVCEVHLNVNYPK